MPTTSSAINNLNKTLRQAVAQFKPPERVGLIEWAEKYRYLSEGTAEPGLFRVSRTPYFAEPMNAVTDPNLNRITVVASSQVGKTEFELNVLGYVMAVDPGPAMMILPTVDTAEDLSKRRIAPMIQGCKPLREKVADCKGRDSNNTVLKKSFPGGMLTLGGSNAPAALASVPARYVLGDERDRWAVSAGTEGDPWGLLEARTITFPNAMMIDVSTPTVSGHSAIEKSYNLGTMERWCTKCPHCGELHEVRFKNIVFDYEKEQVSGVDSYTVKSVAWACPTCGGTMSQQEERAQPHEWRAENSEAYKKGHRSFWITAFSSPWMTWEQIVLKFLEAHNDVQKLKTVFNTLLGELWEERGEIQSEDELLARRESYPAELPSGVLVLTCGVDTQDDRLEYEVVGFGHNDETWGITRGVIPGSPREPAVWRRLDDLLDHAYYFADGKALRISFTCVDSGGHFTQEVYEECRKRASKLVFPIKGRGGDGIPFTKPFTRCPVNNNPKVQVRLYTIGVDAGKANIMSALKVQRPGPGYCHFPIGDERGYDTAYFKGLISERMVPKTVSGQTKWVWEKIPGHTRNEPLDCRDYALAAFCLHSPDLQAAERRLKETDTPPVHNSAPVGAKRKSTRKKEIW